MLIPVNQRKPLGQSQHEITPGTRVCAEDGIIGAVERAEVLDKGRLVAVWVHANGAFARDVRIPSEWIRRTDVNGNLLVAGARAKNRSVPWLMNAATRVRPLSRRHNCDWSRQQRG